MNNLDKRSIHLRKNILKLFSLGQKTGGGGHFGGAFSLVEILRVVYDDFAKFNVKKPKWSNRDRVILSKGHGCLALYSILYDKGFISKKIFFSYGKKFSLLGGHPEHHLKGVEASTGSLGHGLPIGLGIALAAKLKKKKYRSIIIVGDGELNEGSNWEAAITASKYLLNNLIVIVDHNKYQSYGKVKDVSGLDNLKSKFKSFGFNVKKIDGHNISKLKNTLSKTKYIKNKPTAIICDTVKGKGYSEAENNPNWHYAKNINSTDIQKILTELK